MSMPIVRIFESPIAATAFEALAARGFSSIELLDRNTPGSAAALWRAGVYKAHGGRYETELDAGRSIVVVHAPFGRALECETLLRSFGPIAEPVQRNERTRFLSDLLGTPLLVKKAHRARHPGAAAAPANAVPERPIGPDGLQATNTPALRQRPRERSAFARFIKRYGLAGVTSSPSRPASQDSVYTQVLKRYGLIGGRELMPVYRDAKPTGTVYSRFIKRYGLHV